MPKIVEVTIERIQCESVGGDGGNNMEVYGTIWAGSGRTDHDMDLNRNEIWRLDGDHPHDVAGGGSIDIYRTVRVPLYPGEWLHIEGQLTEEDDWPDADDDLGWIYASFHESSIDDNFRNGSIGPFEEGGQKVYIKYTFIQRQ
ncbi:hypothetical protein [Bacillus cereus]|uniref:hypothetical protein n=1 Tax=Bacillus cereus TaxID=1396 RepID=UPI00217CC2B2|nr:hypothetical protein [Bacillus cereus]MCS6595305.1 hypothetical protein [Bacillus cereus]